MPRFPGTEISRKKPVADLNHLSQGGRLGRWAAPALFALTWLLKEAFCLTFDVLTFFLLTGRLCAAWEAKQIR